MPATAPEEVKVLVVDDHSLFRAGVVQALGLDPSIRVVAEGSRGSEAVRLAGLCKPDIVLLDISMPDDGTEAAAAIACLPDAPRIVMLTVSEDGNDILRAVDAGAVGYLLKRTGATELIGAVRSVAAGESFLSPTLSLNLLASMRRNAKEDVLRSLSAQEERTLRLVAEGLGNREVGERLGILEKTVKYHMTNILRKLKVRNRVEAALLARKSWGER